MTKIISLILFFSLNVCVFLTTVDAKDIMNDSPKNSKIRLLASLSAEDAFQRLKEPDFFYEEELLNRGIKQAFSKKKKDGIRLALTYIQKSQKQGDVQNARSFYVAKRILQKFPKASIKHLAELYYGGGPQIRKNVVQVVAGMQSEEVVVRSILTNALDDKQFCEEELPDSMGDPLRVCDVAYNQIVLHFGIRDVLRTIGTAHRIEVRDYHIDKIRSLY